MNRQVLLLATFLLTPFMALPQGLLQGGEAPLVVEADEGIEWVRDEKKYIARGNARAQRGGVELRGDILTAHYRETGDETGQNVYKVVAKGNVQITSNSARIFGDHGEYKADDANFVLVGKNLRIESNRALITARDQLEYWEARQLFVARGNATVVKEDKRLRADVLTALVGLTPAGNQEIQQVNVWGNVHISTATEIVRARKGVYNLQTGLVTLEENVKITRGKTQLNGAKAIVDLNAGISRLVGGKGRVKGLLPTRRSKRR